MIGPGDDYAFRRPSDAADTYYGRFALPSILRLVTDKCNEFAYDSSLSFLAKWDPAEAFDIFTFPPVLSTRTAIQLLPAKSRVQSMCRIAMCDDLPCHDCVDQEKFFEALDVIYDQDSDVFTTTDYNFMALVFALMAFRRRHDREPSDTMRHNHADKMTLKGY